MKMKNRLIILFLLATVIAVSSCSRNYYSGTGKGGRGCGCPSARY